MTMDQVRAGLRRATAEAFRQGQIQARTKTSEAETLAAAMQYADLLLTPLIEALVEEAVEIMATTMIRAALDPEPGPDAPG